MDMFIPDKLEYYDKLNVLKAGLIFSDKLTTVSPTYAREIQTPESGCGLDGVLRARSSDLSGILNGIDYSIWSPETDNALPEHYSASKLANKMKIKQYLLNLVNLPVISINHIPLIGNISRLVDQKGYDLISVVFPELMKLNVQMIILGTGEEKYHNLLTELSRKYPEKITVNLHFDDRLAHLIYAGTDMFLMPSRYEPCGLGQLIALKYGSVPVVNSTGGLADTIQDYNSETRTGNGFVMQNYTPEELLKAIKRGIELYTDNHQWETLMHTGMSQDFSWNDSAKKYLYLYNTLLS
jgi:starch synthase